MMVFLSEKRKMKTKYQFISLKLMAKARQNTNNKGLTGALWQIILM